jgi:hypothetical protein
MSGCKVIGIVGVGVGAGVEKGNGGVGVGAGVEKGNGGVGVGVGVTCILSRLAIDVDAAVWVVVVVKIRAIETKIRSVN